jgi:hypothetical protein
LKQPSGKRSGSLAEKNQLAGSSLLDNDTAMTRKQIESAVLSGRPFTLRMADGKDYPVPHPDHISLPPNASYVIVYDDQGSFTVLPLLTMTGLESKTPDAGIKQK